MRQSLRTEDNIEITRDDTYRQTLTHARTHAGRERDHPNAWWLGRSFMICLLLALAAGEFIGMETSFRHHGARPSNASRRLVKPDSPLLSGDWDIIQFVSSLPACIALPCIPLVDFVNHVVRRFPTIRTYRPSMLLSVGRPTYQTTCMNGVMVRHVRLLTPRRRTNQRCCRRCRCR